MSDTESKDDWTILLAKEAQVLRSGQAWADIVDDDDGDNDDCNQANDQHGESSTTEVNNNNEKPVDYLDDIDLAIPTPQPRVLRSSPVSFDSQIDDRHLGSDSDNWRVRDSKERTESDNWRVRDPQGAKPTSFTNFGNKDRSEIFGTKDRSEIIRQRQEERKEYRQPEKRRIDPEDAVALAKWNTFHLVVAQEELEKEKEKERLKQRYLESCGDGGQLSELVKGNTNTEICINFNESQKIVDQNQNTDGSKLDSESASKKNSSDKQGVRDSLQENKVDPVSNHKEVSEEKKSLEKKQSVDDSLDLEKPESLDRDKGPLDINKEDKKDLESENTSFPHKDTAVSVDQESVKDDIVDLTDTENLQKPEELKEDEKLPATKYVEMEHDVAKKENYTQKNSIIYEKEEGSRENGLDKNSKITSDKLPINPEKETEVTAHASKILEEKDKSANEDKTSGPENEDKGESPTTQDILTRDVDSNDVKEESIITEEGQTEKEDSAYDETEFPPTKEEETLNTLPVKDNQPKKNILEINEKESSISMKEDEETKALSKCEEGDDLVVPSDSTVGEKHISLMEAKETVMDENIQEDSSTPSEQPPTAPVTQNKGIEESKKVVTAEIEHEKIQTSISLDNKIKEEENGGMERTSEVEENERIDYSETSSKDRLDISTEHQVLMSKSSENVLEKGDSLEEIKKEYVNLEKQISEEKEPTHDSKGNEIPVIVHKQAEKEDAKEDLQSDKNQSIDKNIQNEDQLNENNIPVEETQIDSSAISIEQSINVPDQTNSTGWGEVSVKKKVDEEKTTGSSQKSAKDVQKDSTEVWGQDLTNKEVQWGKDSQSNKDKSQQGNATSWDQDVTKDNSNFDNKEGWGQETTKQWGEVNWGQNQNSDNVMSKSSQSWGTIDTIKSPEVVAVETAGDIRKKASRGNWRDQVKSTPKDDNVGGWKQFASNQAALNVVSETKVESPKPKKVFLPKSMHSSPKLKKSWTSDSTSLSAQQESWSKKSDISQTASSISSQSNISQEDSSSWTKNQETWSRSPNISHTNSLRPNIPVSSPTPSVTSHTDSLSSNAPSAPNPWAQFSISEMERSARSQNQNNRSQFKALSAEVQPQPKVQQKHNETQATQPQQPTEPPVINISLSDFESVQLESKGSEKKMPSAPIEINMSWNGDDIIIHSTPENSNKMHAPLTMSLDNNPVELSVTPKLNHATLTEQPFWTTTKHSEMHPEPSSSTESSGSKGRPRIQMDGSQWKLMSKILKNK